MTNLGIDYGLGKTNIDHETGIRFGVISQNSGVLQAWADSSEPHYGLVECPQCKLEVEPDFYCSNCEAELDDYSMLEPLSFYYEEEGYSCEAGDDGDIFVLKSPYYTYAQFCPPCAPGAVHLENPIDAPPRGKTVGIGYMPPKGKSNRGYCFGHDWFEGEKAPYKVYSVKTGKEISAKQEEAKNE